MIQLFKGDCLELMKSIPDGSIDALFTFLPTLLLLAVKLLSL